MTNKTVMAIAIMAITFISAGVSYAGSGWQFEITAKVLNAENRLVVGQEPDASDGLDGMYDVPALLSGDIQAYIDLEGDTYWKDIKEACAAPCKKTWTLVVESWAEGQTVELGWKPSGMPAGVRMVLTDMATGEEIDMKKEQGYAYVNRGRREFTVGVQTW